MRDTAQAMKELKPSQQRFLRIICYVAPAALLSAIWFPEISHYYVPKPTISDQMIEAGRQLPSDSVLEELNGYHYLESQRNSESHLIGAAEKLLEGVAEVPGYPPTTLRMPFDPGDIDRGSQQWQLALGGLVVPETLLRAYELTGRDEFFFAARDVILGWAHYERHSCISKGYLWNDHALAARITVLGEFWRLYRHRTDYQLAVARGIWEFAARSGAFLAKPSHFTVATNHGVMQNLALWHLCLAFPTLPQVDHYKRLAFDRLREQMGFYVDAEGVVLEHSPGYHKFGLELIGTAFRYLSLLHEQIPQDWIQKYEQANKFYAELRRPDGSLPMLGDTDGRKEPNGPRVVHFNAEGHSGALVHEKSWIPPQAFALYPVSGYAIWWDGLESGPNAERLNQTVVSWSYHPGHGHKHSDEMSVALWAAGQTWWTNVGYWPYGVPGRKESESWPGSNAPHLVGEQGNSPRQARLVSFGESGDLAVIEMERTGLGDYVASRLVLHRRPNLWVVVDHTTSNAQVRSTTTWTSAHNVLLRRGSTPGSYILEAEGRRETLDTFFLTSPGASVRLLRGSLNPFAGWQVIDQVPKEAPALAIEQPAKDSWAVAVWMLNDGNTDTRPPAAPPRMLHWGGSQNWTLALPLHSGSLEIQRNADRLSALSSNRTQSSEKIKLAQPPDIARQSDELRDRFQAAASKYPRFRDLLNYRVKITYLLMFAFALQELFLAVYRTVHGKYYVIARAMILLGWIGGGTWLLLFYFRVG